MGHHNAKNFDTQKVDRVMSPFRVFYVVNRGATRSVVSFRRGAARSIAPIDGLKRTSTGTRTLVYRVKACRDNHLHYREPLDEIIAAIVCSLRMIGNVMLPPIAHINSCAVCIGELL